MNRISSQDLLELVGSFWSRIVASASLTVKLVAGLIAGHRQSEQSVDELVRSISARDIGAGKVSVWTKLVFSVDSKPQFEYGDASQKYGIGYFYGDLKDNKAIYVLPNDIISIPIMYDDPIKPTVSYVENIDYILQNGKLIFRQPFDSTSTTLYAFKLLRDTSHTYRQLGYVIGVNLSDFLFRKIPLSEFWRLYSYGPNYYNIMRLISLCADAPIALHENEIVQGVLMLPEGHIVITDKEIYFLKLNQLPTVKEGQVLKQADSLSSGIQVLHDKMPMMSRNAPDYMLENNNFKYGSIVANPARVIVIKADIAGDRTAALKYFTNIMPLDTKLVLLSNVNVQAVTISDSSMSFQNTRTLSVRTPPFSSNSFTITPKCNSRIKYGSYGF